MWGSFVPAEWIRKVIDHCKKFENRYLFQSKNPMRFFDLEMPESVIVGTMIETNRDWLVNTKALAVDQRAMALSYYKAGVEKMVSIEPICIRCLG